MNFSEMNNLKKKNLLSSPIYNIDKNKRKMTLDDQTSATSDHSLKNKKKIMKTKSIASLTISSQRTNLLTKNNEGSKSSILKFKSINVNETRNRFPQIESYQTIKKSTKSRNIEVPMTSLKNIKSSDNIKINKLNVFQNQIQKLLRRHKINPLNKSKNQILKSNLLIKDTDITRKRYYFGFMNKEKNNNNENNIITNKKESSENLTINTCSSFRKMKIQPLLNKKEKIKFDIDKLLKKRFESPIEKRIKIPKQKKLKLKPLNFKKVSIIKKDTPLLDKILSEKNLLKKQKYEKIYNNNNNKDDLNSKKNEKSKEKKKTDEKIKRNDRETHSILKHKNSIIENKTVKFTEDINVSNLEKRKSEKENSKRKRSSKKLSSIGSIHNLEINQLILEEESFSHEYEDSGTTDSEEEKYKRKILREKMRNNRNSLIGLSKQIIKSYEFFTVSKKDKNFLLELCPENFADKKFQLSDYSNILNNSRDHIQSKVNLKQKEYIKHFKYSIKNFQNNFNDNLIEEIFENELKKVQILLFPRFLNVGLDSTIAFHLMNTYIPIVPEFIENFISNKTNEKTKLEDNDFSFVFKAKKRKSVLDIKDILLFDAMTQTKENLIFYQRFIYCDYGKLIFCEKEDLTSLESSFHENNDNSHEKNTIKKKKKKRIHLNILRKKLFFNMDNIKRQVMSSALEKYLNYQDDVIKVLVKKIEQLKNKHKEDPDIELLCYRLFDYLIRNQSNNLVFRFHHRYHKLFDINYSDPYNNGNTLLIIATKENSLNLVKYFLDKGANPNIANDFGNTPMHYAISHKCFEIADILRKSGAREDIANFKGLIPWECDDGVEG